jgi:hypothetical protein
MSIDLRKETVIGVALLVLGLILLFRLFGFETFQDAPAAAGVAEAIAPIEEKKESAADAKIEATPDVSAAQDNSAGPADDSVVKAEQEVASTEVPVSPAEPSTVITAPGVVRPADAGSVRPSFPAAAGLEGVAEGGPFEKYVQMLVRSELAAEGRTAAVAAEAFVAKEEGAIENATGYVKGAWQGIFGKPAGPRI